MKLTNNSLHKIREAAIELFKQKHFAQFDSELQATLCTILAFADFAQLEVELEKERQGWETQEPD